MPESLLLPAVGKPVVNSHLGHQVRAQALGLGWGNSSLNTLCSVRRKHKKSLAELTLVKDTELSAQPQSGCGLAHHVEGSCKMWGITGSCVNRRCSAVAFHSSVAGGSGDIHCCVTAVPPLTGSSIPGMQREPALPFLKARHPTLPVALFHQCLSLFFAGVFLSLIGLEQDLL